MLFIRNISRSTLRSAARLSAQPARRTLTSFSRPSALQQTSRISSLLPRRAAFSSTSVFKQTQEGQTDGELSAKLQEEYNMEEEMGSTEGMPAHLSEYLDNSGFSLQEEPGNQEVRLTKQFGNEKITVTFSIADLDAFDADADPYGAADPALADEGADDPNGSASAVAANTSGGKGSGTLSGSGGPTTGSMPPSASAEAAELAAEEAEGEEGEQEPNFPVRIDVLIEKQGAQGAMQFSSTASDGQIITESVFHFPTRDMADAKTAQADWERRTLYTGPPYGNLDEDLQALTERYLDERGINTALALWVPEYIDFKEQREYLNFLQSWKNFVDA